YQLALLKNGMVKGWGSNGGHHLDIPAGLTNVTAISAGGYAAGLIGGGEPVVNSSLPDLTVNYGDTVHLRAEATGASPLSYQWQLNGTDVPGATNLVLQLEHIDITQAGQYSILVRNSIGSTSVVEMALTVSPLSITAQPKGQSGYPNGSVVFTCGAVGQPTLAYQWHFNDVDLPGATDAALTLTNLQYAQTGMYSVSVNNFLSTLKSAPAVLWVGPIAAWGDNTKGQITVPLYLTNIIAVAAGDSFSLALASDGKVFAWGDNSSGQTNVP